MNEKNFLTDLSLHINNFDDTIPYRDIAKFVEKEMKINELKQMYQDKITLQGDGRFYLKVNKKQYRAQTKDELFQKIYADQDLEERVTLSSMWESFINHRYLHVSNGTYRDDVANYEKFLKNSDLMEIPVSEINIDNLDKWAEECFAIKPNMKEKYFKNVVSTLSMMFEYLKAKKIPVDNVARGYSPHRDYFEPAKKEADNDRFFSENEYFAVKELAYEDAELRDSALPLGIVFLSLTGIRDGELCALKWRDIDLVNRKLNVVSEMVEKSDKEGKFLGYEHVGHTKTVAGTRSVPLNPEAINLSQLIQSYNQSNNISCEKDDFVFLRIKKGAILNVTSRCFESRIKNYCKKLGITPKSQHDMRRTFATMLYYNGWKEKDIQKIMGHSSVKQTQAYIMYDMSKAEERSLDCLTRSAQSGTEM